ncbi:TRP4 [Sanghuangporus sanghuang]
MSSLSPATFRPLLSKLISTPEYFSTADLSSALTHLFTPGTAEPVQIGAFLAALHLSRIERRPEMLLSAAQALRERALKADIEAREEDFVVDIVGTGGDGHDTFNVSTTAAVVAAGAGARVCKHGSRASTSSSGSADLLQSLGCLFTPPTASTPMHIRRIPFTFILAPHYHPALAHIAPYRKALPFRTMFNILGPLINPAFPHGMVLGVADPALGEPFAMSLRESGVERALVVCGRERLDEVSCAGETDVWELTGDGRIVHGTLHPTVDFGLRVHPLSRVAGGTPEENARTFRTLLTSGDAIPEALEPILEYVLMNASALLFVAGIASDYRDGVRRARESIVSGKAWEALATFKEEGERAAADVTKN